MAIPLSALRRALADAARNPKFERTLAAPVLGAGAGGAFGAAGSALDGDYSDAGEGAMAGAGIGAGIGALGTGAMFRKTLREALAEKAASRGLGRRAVREMADAEDAATFAARSPRRDVPLVEEMRSAGSRPFARAPDAMDEMQELQAASRILRRLKQERIALTNSRQNGAYADPDEVADLDEQIAELTRLLGG